MYVSVISIIMIIIGFMIIQNMNDKPNVNKTIFHFQRNDKISQSFPEHNDTTIDRKNTVMVPLPKPMSGGRVSDVVQQPGSVLVKTVKKNVSGKEIIPVSTMVNNDINTRVVSNDVLDVLKMQVDVGRKVELKNQEMKHSEIEREERLRILAGDVNEKKHKVDLKIQEMKRVEDEREETARILTEEIEEKRRQVYLKIQEAKRVAEQAKKDKEERAAAFRAKMKKYKDEKVVIEPTVEEKYARALEIALKKKAVKLKAEAEMKQILDAQRKLNEELSESERLAMEKAAIVRDDLIDENDRLIEEAATKQRELDDAKNAESQAIFDEEYDTVMKEMEEMELIEEERMAVIERNSDKVIADAQDALRDAEKKQNDMDQSLFDQLEDIRLETERLQSIAASAQAEYQDIIRREAIRVSEEEEAHAQYLANALTELQIASAGMKHRRVKNALISMNVPENLRGKILINATNGWPVYSENRDDYKLARVDEDSIEACTERCDKFPRCKGYSHERGTNVCYLFSEHAEQLEQGASNSDMYYKSWKNLSDDEYATYTANQASKRVMRERQKYADDRAAADAEANAERSRVAKEELLLYQAWQAEMKAKNKQQLEEKQRRARELQDEVKRVRLKALDDDRRSRCGPTQILGFETDGNKCSGSACCGNSGSVFGRCGTSSAHCDNRQFWSDYSKYDGPDREKLKPTLPPDYTYKPVNTAPPSYDKLENVRIGVPTLSRNPWSIGQTSINASDGTFVRITSRALHKLTEVDEGNVDACMKRCDKFDKCEGFVHERSTNKCFLKSNHAKKLQDTGVDGYDMYYKTPVKYQY